MITSNGLTTGRTCVKMCIATAMVKQKHKQDNNKIPQNLNAISLKDLRNNFGSWETIIFRNIIPKIAVNEYSTLSSFAAPFCRLQKPCESGCSGSGTQRTWREGAPSAEHFSR